MKRGKSPTHATEDPEIAKIADENSEALLAGLFDLTITDAKGNRLQPEGEVTVGIRFPEEEGLAADTIVYAVHFPGTGMSAEESSSHSDEELSAQANGPKKAMRQSRSLQGMNADSANAGSANESAPELLTTTVQGNTFTFDTDGFSYFAIVEIVIEKTVLASDGHNYRITATFGSDAGIPEGAELAVYEVTEGSAVYGMSYEEYVAYTENVLGMKEGSTGYIRLFDIKIVDKDDHSVKYQPKEGTSVDMRIELADAEDGKDLSVVHFADGSAKGDQVESSTENNEVGTAVEFAADGFSVYSIVDAPEPVNFAPYDLSSVDEIVEGKAYLLSYGSPKKYFTSNMNGNSCLIETTDSYSAAEWYFETVSGKENTYYIYT